MYLYNKLAPYFSGNGEDFFILKDKKSGRKLRVSATEDGLKWATDKDGRMLYYENGKIKVTPDFVYITPTSGKELIKSDKVIVVKMNYGQAS